MNRLVVGQSITLRRVVSILGVPDALVPLDLPVSQINLAPGYCLHHWLCVIHLMQREEIPSDFLQWDWGGFVVFPLLQRNNCTLGFHRCSKCTATGSIWRGVLHHCYKSRGRVIHICFNLMNDNLMVFVRCINFLSWKYCCQVLNKLTTVSCMTPVI